MSMHDIELDIFLKLAWEVGTPVAYKAILMAERGDWLGLSRIDVRPHHYCDASNYLQDAQIASYFKKLPGLSTGLDLEAKAVEDFWDSEHQCYQTNERLSPLLFDLGHYGEPIKKLLLNWRKRVRCILGRAPLDSALQGRFGPGSTFSNRGNLITLAHKLSDNYTATRQALSFLPVWDETAWSRYAACDLVGDPTESSDTVEDPSGFMLSQSALAHSIRDFTVTRGNRFTTVDKDSRSKRGICVEPSLNLFYQLAIGSFLSKRMNRFLGWEKETAQDFHKSLARIGSLTGAVATLDLSRASDTVCTTLVKLLLPEDWYDLVCRTRSSHTLLKGHWVKLEKFSSMGNGFTFELETLIFYTLSLSVEECLAHDVDPYCPGVTTSVFGDDIICPTNVSRPLARALSFFGFSINDQKSFFEGPFRESCGGDYFKGFDVRPTYVRNQLEEPHHLIALANGIRRLMHRSDAIDGGRHYRTAWFRCLDYIPRQIRICRGPEALGDLVIHDDEDHWKTRNPVAIRSSIRYLRVWRPVSNRVIGWDNFRPGVVLAYALYGGESNSPTVLTHPTKPRKGFGGVIPRISGSYVSGYRFGRVAYS